MEWMRFVHPKWGKMGFMEVDFQHEVAYSRIR